MRIYQMQPTNIDKINVILIFGFIHQLRNHIRQILGKLGILCSFRYVQDYAHGAVSGYFYLFFQEFIIMYYVRITISYVYYFSFYRYVYRK